MMPGVMLTTTQAGQALGLSRQAVWAHVRAGRLNARLHGIRRHSMIEVGDLRLFANEFNYELDEQYLSRLANQEIDSKLTAIQ